MKFYGISTSWHAPSHLHESDEKKEPITWSLCVDKLKGERKEKEEGSGNVRVIYDNMLISPNFIKDY